MRDKIFWQSPAKLEAFRLTRAGDVHIWCAALHEADYDLAALWKILDASEQARAIRFVYEQHKTKFIIAHGILRKLIAQYLQTDPAKIRFQHNFYGKPKIASPDSINLQFNLSHSHDLALMAFTLDNSIGVDVEFIKEKIEFADIAARFFTQQEKDDILVSADKNSQKQAFFACWARKEAFIKALGKGLAFALDKIEVSVADFFAAESAVQQVPFRVRSTEFSDQLWQLFAIKPCADYAAALALNGKLEKCKLFCY